MNESEQELTQEVGAFMPEGTAEAAPEATAEATPEPSAEPAGDVSTPPETPPDDTQERMQALDERERELLRRETRLLALDALVSRGLPPELIDALPLESEERMREALEGVDAAFRRAVEQSVHRRLAGAPPRLGGDGPGAQELALRRALGLNG
ncbi:MAG: DUF4355 domain-containing protein [Eubacteriales bacterium]|nr:DUF4355 domain-containing protein [Eubacteriales bacterium]